MNPLGAVTTLHHIRGPHIDWASLSPIVVLAAGALVVLLTGLIAARFVRSRLVPGVTVLVLAGAIAAEIARYHHNVAIIAGALKIDDLALTVDMICAASAIAATLLALRGRAVEEAGQGEFHALLLFSVMGMAVFISAQDLITLFIGIELLSIPLYVLCAAEYRREGSLESGLKYLVIGSVGSATLVYGLAMIYGATGSTSFAGIAAGLAHHPDHGGVLGDPLMFVGLALAVVGFAFKASVAPFHQWTPDVYEGAPTPVTAFMATATKAAALAVFLRFFDVAALGARSTWAPLLATVAAITIIVGNAGALGQSSLKRMLGYSGVAQAGYMLAGVIVGTRLGVNATVLYLIVYALMNLAAFAAIVGVELDGAGDDMAAIAGLGARRPWLAWPLTVAMLALAGIPGTVGFIGKFQLIHALVNGNYTWLAIVLVIGSMISLGYYLRVIAAMWMGRSQTEDSAYPAAGIQLAPIAGGSPEADEMPTAPAGAVRVDGGDGRSGRGPLGSSRVMEFPEVAFVAAVFGAATVVFGIIPGPLFHLAAHAGAALTGLL